MRRVTQTLACGALLLLGSTAAASAAIVPVGDSTFTPNSSIFQVSGFVQATSAGNAYTFPSAGTVSSFQTRAWDAFGVSGPVQAVVYRHTTGGSYTIVARSTAAASGNVAGSLTSGTFSPAATVQAGDILGLETTGGGVEHSIFNGSSADSRAQYVAPFAAVGGTQSTLVTAPGIRVNVSATLVTDGVTTCVQSAVRRAGSAGFAGAFDQSDVTVTASNGLQSISNVQITNGAISVPGFTAGTTSPVIVTATKATQGVLTRFSFDATDTAGATKHCG